MNPNNRSNTDSKQHQHPTPMPGQNKMKINRPPRNKREGYESRLEERQGQGSPVGSRGKVPGRGPFKGPSKRPSGIGNDSWRKYMRGESDCL